MGQITVTFNGSFGHLRTKQFSAMDKGHAAAIAEAISYLSEVEMPKAIKNDHECHRDNIEPRMGFGGQGLVLKTEPPK